MRWIGLIAVVGTLLVGLRWYQEDQARERLARRSQAAPERAENTPPKPIKLEQSPTQVKALAKPKASAELKVSGSARTQGHSHDKKGAAQSAPSSSRAERMEACADCHPEHVEGYLGTPMGESWSTPTDAEATENFDPKKTTVRDLKSGLLYRAFRDEGGDYWQEEFHPATGYTRRMQVAFIIGSGKRNRTYLGWLGNELVESPLTWYQDKGLWDLSPGYHDENQRFNRRADAACLFCHNGLTPVESSIFAQYRRPVAQGIDCRRCHGDASAHIAARLDGKSPPAGEADPTIYNPGHEAPARKQQVCDQCHLQGAARVLHDGKTWRDYAPSTPLHEVASVFLESQSSTDAKPKFLDFPYRIAMSPCGESTQLTCVTCHDPHRRGTVASYREACQSCHGPKGCTESAGRAQDAHCAGCHMQRRGTADIPHAQGVDHFIRRRPESGAAEPTADTNSYLVHAYAPLREPDTERDADLLALGLFKAFKNALGDTKRKHYGEKAMSALSSVVMDGKPSWKSINALAQLMTEQGHHDSAMKLLRKAIEKKPSSEGLWMGLAIAAEKAGDKRTAIEAYGRVNALLPQVQRALAGEGKVRVDTGDERGGLDLLKRADEVSAHDPSVAAALGGLAVRKRDLEEAKRWLGEAVRRDPLDAQSQLKLCGLLMASGDLPGADRCASDALEFNLNASGLYWIRARARMGTGQLMGARPDLIHLLKLDPERPEAYAELARIEAALGRREAARQTLKEARERLGAQPIFEAVERELMQGQRPLFPRR